MEIKHQVFISSTYQDLIKERAQVMQALLELDCIPAGMEMFPATNEDAWTLIKDVISNSDYYVLVIAGKYGSVDSENVSYTEKEYDYAVSIGKPIISFLHENPAELSATKNESKEDKQVALKKFRDKVKGKHCKFWTNPDDLGSKVSRSLVALRKKHPSDGWVKGCYAQTSEDIKEIEELRRKLTELEGKEASQLAPAGTESFASGEDLYGDDFEIKKSKKGVRTEVLLKVTWDNLFSYIGSSMHGECNDDQLLYKIRLCFYHAIPTKWVKFNNIDYIIMKTVMVDEIKIQLQALGLIEAGVKKRAVSDNQCYWKLTKYGEKYLLKISAIKKRVVKAVKKEE